VIAGCDFLRGLPPVKGCVAVRIAQVAPLHEAVPPKLYGGTERVVSFLTEELVALGHEVTLFASADSRTTAALVPAWPRALRLDPAIRDTIAPHMLLMEEVRQRAGEFDMIHFHMDYWPFSIFSRQRTPFLTTLHGRLDLPEIRPIFARFPDAPVVSISDDQRRGLPRANYVRTVHHGLPTLLLAPQPGAGRDYLAFLGRITPEKGPDRAIRIARTAGIPLKIAAKVSETDRAYFDSVVRPMIAEGGVEMIGEISDAEKPAFLSGAIGLLMPIDWPEPFGLVMIEAMACGTPVIAFSRGSVPEIVEDGRTGFIVANEEEAVQAVSRLPQISSAFVRSRFDHRFTARRMADDYVAVYRNLIEASIAMRDSKPLHVNVRPSSQRRQNGVAAVRRTNVTIAPDRSSDARLQSVAFAPPTSLALSARRTDAD
jgi:glycosyltransferase involved in cell wall biosynthesis